MDESTQILRNIDNDGPVFVIGCPRSGNTLVAAILNKHPDLMIFFESNIFYSLYRFWIYRCKKKPGEEKIHFINIVSSDLSHFYRYNKDANLSRKDIEKCIENIEPEWGALIDAYMQILLPRIKPTARRWGDKTPHHVSNIVQILDEIPNAKIIYVNRDPRHVVASLSKKTFPHNSDDRLVNSYVVHSYNKIYRSQIESCENKRVLEIRYEDLVKTPCNTVKIICEFLSIEYLPELLSRANNRTRNLVSRGLAGWYNDKAWDEITPQEVASYPNDELIKMYFSNCLEDFNYTSDHSNYPMYVFVYLSLRLVPFIIVKYIVMAMWKFRYPDFIFLMQRYPSLANVRSWLKITTTLRRL